MKIRIYTGRTHQIRVHMKYLNCPILGDPVYFKPDRKFSSATLMLHARHLCIPVNEEGKKLDLKTPLPERFKSVMKILKRDYKKTILPDEKE